MSGAKVAKWIFTILLVNGEKMTHTYEVPLVYNELMKFIEFMTKNIEEALKKPKRKPWGTLRTEGGQSWTTT